MSGEPALADLRAVPPRDLPLLAQEIRAHLVKTVGRNGGHLGPNLGVVELTLALHRVFDSPRDAIVWDTGHQAYVHKMVTGRAAAFDGLRVVGGLSGYPSRAESEHDLVENSHASTALSYADGLAKAAAVTGSDRRVVAVVGDGALTGGMCWEALNNIGGAPDRPVIVVLNDNGRSYSPTVGSLASHLAALRGGGTARSLFAELGFGYLGPVDGHDVPAVEAALRSAAGLRAPVVVHCVTVKGRGWLPAETDEADCLHAVNPAGAAPAGEAWTSVLAEELVAIGAERPDVVTITAAMLHPTGLGPFALKYPDRCYDVGIAEQHAVTSAAGLAMGGLHPVVCVYSTFLNRAFDQVLMDVALHRLPVTFVLDRAGITGSDGASHHGMWDLTLLAAVPGMRVAAPRDAERLRELVREATVHTGPTAVRFPKGEAPPELPATGRLGSADLLYAGGDGVLVVAAGAMAGPAVAAARTVPGVTVVDPRWVLPVRPDLVAAAGAFGRVVTVEDNGLAGGVGDAVARALRAAGSTVPVRTLGIAQDFVPHGSRGAILAEHGLDAAGIARALRD